MPIEKTQTLVPGTELVGRYKQTQYRATVREDGIYVEPAPLTPATAADAHGPFKTLSAAGRAVMGGISCNGWRFWSLAGEKIIGSELAPAGKTPAVKATRVAQIRKLPNQKNVPEGQTKHFCSACKASFLVAGTETPEACPSGHPRKVRACASAARPVDEFAAAD